MKQIILAISFLLIYSSVQSQTVGLQSYEKGTEEGYVLFSPFKSTDTYLIDNCGQLINKWESDFLPAAATVLLENGNLLKTSATGPGSNSSFAFGGGGQYIQEIDWDGNVVWEFEYSDSTHRMHHDFVRMPNGNILIPAWESKTREEAIEAGRNPDLIPDGELWGEYVIEVSPAAGGIVWEWHMWDHLIQDIDSTKDNYGVIAEHPELLDINRTGGPTANGAKNWLHINSIDYNPMMDQIMLNTFFISEFYIIDHSTSTEEASTNHGGNSSMGGDLLYRWGNPENYDHGTADDRTIYGSHKAHWIAQGLVDEGKVMIFNNGNGRPGGSHSSIDVIVTPVNDYITGTYIYEGVAFDPAVAEWSYEGDPVESFYSDFLSGGQRLANGNTMICSGANGRFFEINDQKEIVWEYINPVVSSGVLSQGDTIPVVGGRMDNFTFRCTRYELDYPGLANKDLTAEDPIELNFTMPYDCTIRVSADDELLAKFELYPNPASDLVVIEFDGRTFGSGAEKNVEIVDLNGKTYRQASTLTDRLEINVEEVPTGVYLVKVMYQQKLTYRKLVIE